jgi:hypothetical protein
MVEPVGRRARRAQRRLRKEQRRVDQMKAAAERWISKHGGLIEALRDAGHNPTIETRWVSSDYGAGPASTMSCRRCGLKYRGRLLAKRWGLSPKRPCVVGGKRFTEI